jgi:hypothetical protein
MKYLSRNNKIYLFILVLAVVNMIASLVTFIDGYVGAGLFGAAASCVLLIAVHILCPDDQKDENPYYEHDGNVPTDEDIERANRY